MSEREPIAGNENLEDEIDEQGRNLTQQRMDADGTEQRAVDVEWTGDVEGTADSSTLDAADAAPEAMDAAENEVTFEPDVPLVGEVNREQGGRASKGKIAALAGGLATLGALSGAAIGKALKRRRSRKLVDRLRRR